MWCIGGAATFVPTLRQRCPTCHGRAAPSAAVADGSVASSVLRPHPTSDPRTGSAYGFCLSEPARHESSAGENSQSGHADERRIIHPAPAPDARPTMKLVCWIRTPTRARRFLDDFLAFKARIAIDCKVVRLQTMQLKRNGWSRSRRRHVRLSSTTELRVVGGPRGGKPDPM